MWKFLLGVAIVVFATFCGYLLAKKYRQRKEFFSQLCEFNERFLSEIAYYRRPIREFAASYRYQGEFQSLLQTYFENIENCSPTDRSLVGLANYTFLNEEEKRAVEDYFLMLGKGDSTSQKGYFNSVKTLLANKKTKTDDECKRYGDLYVKIGFLCGLLVLILII